MQRRETSTDSASQKARQAKSAASGTNGIPTSLDPLAAINSTKVAQRKAHDTPGKSGNRPSPKESTGSSKPGRAFDIQADARSGEKQHSGTVANNTKPAEAAGSGAKSASKSSPNTKNRNADTAQSAHKTRDVTTAADKTTAVSKSASKHRAVLRSTDKTRVVGKAADNIGSADKDVPVAKGPGAVAKATNRDAAVAKGANNIKPPVTMGTDKGSGAVVKGTVQGRAGVNDNDLKRADKKKGASQAAKQARTVEKVAAAAIHTGVYLLGSSPVQYVGDWYLARGLFVHGQTDRLTATSSLHT